MAWPWPERKKHNAGEWTGFLERGVIFEGKLEASGTLRIDSTAKGTLVSHETLILGEHAVIEGQIFGQRVLIEGRFTGTIQARGPVEIRSNAIVSANIDTPCLVLEPGSVFEGECRIPNGNEETRPITIAVRSPVPVAESPATT